MSGRRDSMVLAVHVHNHRHLELLSQTTVLNPRNTLWVFLELSHRPLARCEARTTRERVSAQTRVGRSICLDIYYGRPRHPTSPCTTAICLFYGEWTSFILRPDHCLYYGQTSVLRPRARPSVLRVSNVQNFRHIPAPPLPHRHTH